MITTTPTAQRARLPTSSAVGAAVLLCLGLAACAGASSMSCYCPGSGGTTER